LSTPEEPKFTSMRDAVSEFEKSFDSPNEMSFSQPALKRTTKHLADFATAL